MAWLNGSGGWGNSGGWGSGRGNGNWQSGSGSWGQFFRDRLSTIIDQGVSSLLSDRGSSGDEGSNPTPPSDSDDSGGSILQQKVMGVQVSTLLIVALGYYVYQSS
jgi:hypothetical protein